MALKINKVESFPEITRVGRMSEELQMIIEALHMSAKTGQKFSLVGIEPGNAYNSMQQRIRAQAKKFGYKIIIRFDAKTKTLYFKASAVNTVKIDRNELIQNSEKLSVPSNQIPSVKTKVSVKK